MTYVPRSHLAELYESYDVTGNVFYGDAASSSPTLSPSPSSSPAPAFNVSASEAAYVPAKTSLNGVRSDLPEGHGVRVRIGELSDGSFGIERYSSAGVRTTVTWS